MYPFINIHVTSEEGELGVEKGKVLEPLGQRPLELAVAQTETMNESIDS